MQGPKRPTEQVYSNYTSEDFEVWKTLYDRQMKNLTGHVSNVYLEALEKVQFNRDEIPHFGQVNDILGLDTGWSLKVVPCISPQKEFFELLAQKRFTATCWLRSMAQLDYLEEPDMFHDVFGHVPLLSNQAYCDFFKGISDIALDHLDAPKAIELLGRIYWFTIEFGLIRENGDTKIYGAGIISSAGETRHSMDTATTTLDFDVRTVFETNYRTDIIQEKYFVIDSFEQLYSSLPEVRSVLEEILADS